MDPASLKPADSMTEAAIEAAVQELLNQWDENYLCGFGLDSTPN